jgi:hypothetical protein
MAESQIQQLNLTFLPVEDRLLLRITSSRSGEMAEYRLLLTRRFVKLLWNDLDHVLEMYFANDPRITPEGRGVVQQFQQSAALSQADFTTPYTSEKLTAPLGGNPLLIYKFQAIKESGDSCTLSLTATTGQTISITLNLQLIHSLRKLLADIIREAEWDLHCSIIPEDAVFIVEPSRTIN